MLIAAMMTIWFCICPRDFVSSEEEFERITKGEGVCFGHSLEDLIQGQIDAGFLIAGFYEDTGNSLLDKYIPTFFATKAVKI